MTSYSFWIALCCVMQFSQIACGGFTVLGPTPYRSAADSPFDMSGLGTKFFLEDFEDSEVNTPGLSWAFGGSIGPGGSVDADDGAIDGQGFPARATQAGTISGTGTSDGMRARFEFDTSIWGKYPTRVGFVMTSGGGTLSLIRVFDALGNPTVIDTRPYLFDLNTVEDDRFFGFVNSLGISALEVDKTVSRLIPRNPPVIDHVQYGVPEPSSTLLGLLGLVWVVFCCRYPLEP